jgi:hypothetical protein
VVSEGGLAGIGERLRKLPWSEAHFEGDAVLTHLSSSRFENLEELEKDEWPAR